MLFYTYSLRAAKAYLCIILFSVSSIRAAHSEQSSPLLSTRAKLAIGALTLAGVGVAAYAFSRKSTLVQKQSKTPKRSSLASERADEQPENGDVAAQPDSVKTLAKLSRSPTAYTQDDCVRYLAHMDKIMPERVLNDMPSIHAPLDSFPVQLCCAHNKDDALLNLHIMLKIATRYDDRAVAEKIL